MLTKPLREEERVVLATCTSRLSDCSSPVVKQMEYEADGAVGSQVRNGVAVQSSPVL